MLIATSAYRVLRRPNESAMCAEKSAGARDGTEALAFTETLGGIQAAILKVRVRAPAG
jgi:hypothetical protein